MLFTSFWRTHIPNDFERVHVEKSAACNSWMKQKLKYLFHTHFKGQAVILACFVLLKKLKKFFITQKYC